MGCVSACFFFHLLSAFCEEASMRVLVRCRMSSVLPLSVEPRTSTFASLMTPGEQENRPDERMGALENVRITNTCDVAWIIRNAGSP